MQTLKISKNGMSETELHQIKSQLVIYLSSTDYVIIFLSIDNILFNLLNLFTYLLHFTDV